MNNICCLTTNYNNGEYLSECIDSVLSQDIKSDILIVDDGSTDNSKEIIQEYAKNNKNIFYIFQENSGPASARNHGLKFILKNNYKYVLLLDSDDYIKENFISECLSILDQEDEIIGVYSDYDILINLKNEQHENFFVREYKRSFNLEDLWKECLMPHLALIRASAFRSVKEKHHEIYDNTLRVCNDYDVDLKLAEFGIIYHIPKSLCVVREGVNNSCSPIQGEIRNNCMQKLRKNNYLFYFNKGTND